MKYQFFAVPVSEGKKEQESLNKFCNQHRVVEVEKQLIMQGGHYVWVFLVPIAPAWECSFRCSSIDCAVDAGASNYAFPRWSDGNEGETMHSPLEQWE